MSQQGILSDSTSPGADIELLTGNSGGAVGPTSHNIDIIGADTVTVTGNPGTSTLTVEPTASGYPTSSFVVGPVGEAGYQTIQAALDAANAAGPNKLIYIKAGSYTENLTCYPNQKIIGEGEITEIIGIHTPPTSGNFEIENIYFSSATDVFSSASVGTINFTSYQCFGACFNGYFLNLPNYSSGEFIIYDFIDESANSGFCNLSGFNTTVLRIYSSIIGSPSLTPLGGNVDSIIIFGSQVRCPVNFESSSASGFFSARNCIFNRTITSINAGRLDLTNNTFRTSANTPIVHNSSNKAFITGCTFDTTATYTIDGTGVVEMASSFFNDNDNFAPTLTFDENEYTHTAEIVANNVQRLKFSGFHEWTGAGGYWTVAGTDFTLDRPGNGYIKGRRVEWLGSQTLSSLAKGNTYYVYIDDTGTIGSTTTPTQALYEDNIVLFEVLVDNDTPANVLVVKENHPYSAPTDLSVYLHNTIGVVISNRNNGANIVVGTNPDEIGISGTDYLEDHGLETTIPDSGGASVSWSFLFTDAGGKWVLDSLKAQFPSQYNNAGTLTALGANKYGIFRLYASKDDVENTSPKYIAVVDDAQYNNLVLAQTAVANGSVSAATNELFDIELAQLGYVVYEQSSSTIVDIIIEKGVIRGNTITSGTDQASLVITDTTNFNGMLSASDTTVQQSLETIDDFYETSTFTPTLAFGGASVGITYSLQAGTYRRMGDMVTINVSLAILNKGTSVGAATIGNIPFTNSSTIASNSLGRYFGLTMPVGYTQPVANLLGADTSVRLVATGSGNAGTGSITDTNFSGLDLVEFQLVYFI